MSSTGEQCFSGGVDGTIQCWNTPSPNIDPYDSYGNGVLRAAWRRAAPTPPHPLFVCRALGAARSLVWAR